jgi:hypothetical protein
MSHEIVHACGIADTGFCVANGVAKTPSRFFREPMQSSYNVIHTVDPKLLYAEEVGLVELQREGKIRHIGVPNVVRALAGSLCIPKMSGLSTPCFQMIEENRACRSTEICKASSCSLHQLSLDEFQTTFWTRGGCGPTSTRTARAGGTCGFGPKSMAPLSTVVHFTGRPVDASSSTMAEQCASARRSDQLRPSHTPRYFWTWREIVNLKGTRRVAFGVALAHRLPQRCLRAHVPPDGRGQLF